MFVDSSAWIALFSARDQNHRTADARFRRLFREGASLLTTSLVVAEVHRLVLHRVGPPAAAAVLDRLDASSRLRVLFPTEQHHEQACTWLRRLADQVITYTDATSFAVMEDAGCQTVATFDRDFVAAGFVLWD